MVFVTGFFDLVSRFYGSLYSQDILLQMRDPKRYGQRITWEIHDETWF